MKLYWTPGSCSQAVHIALREAGLPFDMARVDLMAKTLEDGSDYRAINPRGALPAMELDDGSLLTEGAVLLQYVVDKVGSDALLPQAHDLPRYRVLEWLNYLASEVHKGFSALFTPGTPDAYKAIVIEKLTGHFSDMNDTLTSSEYLANGAYSVADIYAFVMSNWAGMVGVDLSGFAALEAFRGRVGSRPAVQAALKAEGLI